MNALILKNNQSQIALPEDELSDRAKKYFYGSKKENTRKTYARLWLLFEKWCIANALEFMPSSPKTICEYVSYLAEVEEKQHNSIIVYVSAIRLAHIYGGHDPSPTSARMVSEVMLGIKNAHPYISPQKDSIDIDDLVRMINLCPNTMRGLRDKLLLSLQFACACRISEPLALKVKQIVFNKDGADVNILESKTGPRNIAMIDGQKIKAVSILREWLEKTEIKSGFIFRRMYKNDKISEFPLSTFSGQQIWKKYAKAIGLDPERISGHTARASFSTAAIEAGADFFAVMDVTDHKSVEMLRRYKRSKDKYKNHAGKKFL